MTLFPRSSGILLHPTSLPGKYGIGDLGEYAYRFVDYLHDAGQTIWQVLPLGPTSYGDSPYQCLSAFAGNANLISLDKLVSEGWLTQTEVSVIPKFPGHTVDFGPVITYHNQMLDAAYERFSSSASANQKQVFEAWRKGNSGWLEPWALFIALKDENGGRPWVEWPEDEALSKPAALDAARVRLSRQIESHCFRQWVFYTQWGELKHYANGRGIRLVGDIPIFVAHDSSDVWSNRDQYHLDPKGNPTVVAGVPPDYFSETGQRWGNPLYRWEIMAQDGYTWWANRFRTAFAQVDLVRIDHFRGFEAYWEIPAKEATAIKGQWVKGPNIGFFKAIKEKLGNLPIIAEDLGEITPGVIELRDSLGLPGMKILQFAWSGPDNPFLPHNYIPNCVVYTGTHDNNTTVGWWMSGEMEEYHKRFLSEYLDREINTIHDPQWTLARLGMISVAHTFVMPFQDVLGYGAESRMNLPGRESGNWGWRFTADKFDDLAKDHLAYLTRLYLRWPDNDVALGDGQKKA